MPEKTVSQLEAERYHSILITCKNQDCRNCVGYPFELMRINHPRLRNILSGMTIEEMKPKLRCSQCKGTDITVAPHRQEDAPGFAKGF